MTTTLTRSLTARGLAILLIAYIPVNYAFGSVNVLAVDIGRDLGVGSAGQQLVLSAYTATFAAALVIAGRLGDRFGRRRLIAVGSGSIALLSIASALSPNLATLVILRILLGAAAGLLTPQILATIHATAEGTRRTTGVMMFAAMSGGSTVLGQLMAGGLASVVPGHIAWRLVQIAGGLIALVGLAGIRAVPASRAAARPAMDPAGAATLAAALLAIVVSLTLGPGSGWPAWSIVALAGGVVALAAFWRLQLRLERRGLIPLVPPAVLRIPIVRRGLIMTLLFFTTYGAMLYELSALAVERFGMGAVGASLLVLGFGAVFVAMSMVMPRILPNAGAGTMSLAALAQVAALTAIAVLTLTGHDGFWALQFALVPMGAAQALMFGPLIGAVLGRTPHWASGSASGLVTTMQQVGLSLGVAVLGGLFHTVERGAGLDGALAVVFGIHAACGIVFAALARGLR